jgi:lipid II isoglutaminyl synthase (glutamine-hydrolysing)
MRELSSLEPCNHMYNSILIILGKVLTKFITMVGLGSGSTWPGHFALKFNKKFISDVLKKSKTKVILVAGTNGKTTTGKLIQSILLASGNTFLINKSGANLLNGLASTIVLNSNVLGNLQKEFAIFEVDENTVPLILEEIDPDYLICLNLFRDQLDRYGEINSIANKWKDSFKSLPRSTTLILNADDPLISYIGDEITAKKVYFGINNIKLAIKSRQNSADSTYCPFCKSKLAFKEIYFSHLGNWYCLKCKRKRHELDYENSEITPLPGVYNVYNTLAAVLVAHSAGIKSEYISKALSSFTPAFGRQEKLKVNGKTVQLFLSKNPTSFNESLRTISDLGFKNILLVLNDRIPDGRDISWIWDTDLENLLKSIEHITVSGDRVYDIALRIKYAGAEKKLTYNLHLREAIKEALGKSDRNLAILPTYSAMLETRKILTGKKIL